MVLSAQPCLSSHTPAFLFVSLVCFVFLDIYKFEGSFLFMCRKNAGLAITVPFILLSVLLFGFKNILVKVFFFFYWSKYFKLSIQSNRIVLFSGLMSFWMQPVDSKEGKKPFLVCSFHIIVCVAFFRGLNFWTFRGTVFYFLCKCTFQCIQFSTNFIFY